MKQETLDKWNKIERFLLSKPDEYAACIGDKETQTIDEVNQKSNEFLSKFKKDRAKIRAYIANDSELLALSKYKCKKSFLTWILLDTFCKDVNRNPDEEVQAVIPYKHQLELIEKLQFGTKHIHVQKTRRQGASLIMLLFMIWNLLFKVNFHIFTTHKDLASLDVKGDEVNCTFGKMRFTLRRSLFFVERNLSVNDTKRLVYLSNSIDGSVLSPNTTVGFQANLIMVDEIDPVCDAFPNKSTTIFGAFSTSCNRMCLYSTYRSIDYPFYQIRKAYNDSVWDFITLDWNDHPLCNKLWYQDACERMGNDPVLIARELDHNPSKSIKNQILTNLADKHFITYYPDAFQDGWKKIIMADFGGGTSATVFICAFYRTDIKRLFLYRALKTTAMTEHQVKDWIDSVGFANVSVAGDRSGNSNSTTPVSSWKFLLRSVGIDFIPVDNRDMGATHNQINLAILNGEIFFNKAEPNFQDFYTAIKDDKGVLKNDSSHTIDAFGYGYKHLYPIRSAGVGWV